jgi:hypothetical protein
LARSTASLSGGASVVIACGHRANTKPYRPRRLFFARLSWPHLTYARAGGRAGGASAPQRQAGSQSRRIVEMKFTTKSRLLAAAIVCVPAAAWADGIGPFVNGVAAANLAEGSPANALSSDFTATQLAVGTDPLENPSGPMTSFGRLSDGTPTEPDQNFYLVDDGKVKGPTPKYNYGHHFLIQGHENGADKAYVTRINLDVKDPSHRITLLTPAGGDGLTHLNSIDGSTYDPFTRSMLFAQEAGSTTGGVFEVSMDWPASVTTHYGSIGRCGLEGIHVDNKGRVYLVEDTGGKGVSNDPNDPNGPNKVARQPNSYVYRFVPYNSHDLSKGGRLEALQVYVDGAPLVFGGDSDQQAFDDVWSPKQIELHSGASFPTRWVTVHDTAGGSDDFDCNLAARNAGATPFKRPENGAFAPDGTFRTFYFTVTGDTNNLSGGVPELQQRGAFGAIFKLSLDKKQQNGQVSAIVLGDATHNSFDNITFGDSNTILVGEDRGDTLHDQLDALDSIWAYSLTAIASPLRVLAQGRDASASGDGQEDNEPTGVHVFNGERIKRDQYGTPAGLIGARGFFTQQHGDNTVYELIHN